MVADLVLSFGEALHNVTVEVASELSHDQFTLILSTLSLLPKSTATILDQYSSESHI